MNPVPGYDDGIWYIGIFLGIPVAVLAPIFVVWALVAAYRDAKSVATGAKRIQITWTRASSRLLFSGTIVAILGLITALAANALIRWFDLDLRLGDLPSLFSVDGNGPFAEVARNLFYGAISVVGLAILATALSWRVTAAICLGAIKLCHAACYPVAIVAVVSALLAWLETSSEVGMNIEPLWMLGISVLLGLATLGINKQLEPFLDRMGTSTVYE